MPEFGQDMLRHLAAVEEANEAALCGVADLLLERVVRRPGLLLAAGAGHSLIGVGEAFYRAGGLAPVRPLFRPELLPLNGAQASTAAERTSGLAGRVLDDAAPGPDDVVAVFSTSGVNPYPVELARAARGRGLPVVAVTSRACNAAAPQRAGGTLGAEADHVLDTLVRPGDAAYPPGAPVTAAMSTLANGFLWNLLLARLHQRATAAGLELPLWRSSNTADGDTANAALLLRYAGRIPELG
ncbi:sugar isomerase domain-containing protein [Nocardiopsis sediminis]|uniref:Sugar isomerase domain-containing protein n=1 Tax=Nocardiopsis sediminis TaxID=1778267 RepID=A0ABV8FLR5_9ACTN